MSARECAERKRERRRAARARARMRAIASRAYEHDMREVARWRCDRLGVSVPPIRTSELVRAARMLVRREGATRQGVTGDRLALRAALLAQVPCVVLSTGPVQSTARVAIIVDTSDTVIPTGERDGMPVTWVYDGDSIETYRRVVALRSKGGES